MILFLCIWCPLRQMLLPLAILIHQLLLGADDFEWHCVWTWNLCCGCALIIYRVGWWGICWFMVLWNNNSQVGLGFDIGKCVLEAALTWKEWSYSGWNEKSLFPHITNFIANTQIINKLILYNDIICKTIYSF